MSKLAVNLLDRLITARPLSIALLGGIYSLALLLMIAPAIDVWRYINAEGQLAGYSQTLNWAYGFSFVAPLVAFFLLHALREIPTLSSRLASNGMLLKQDLSPHPHGQRLVARKWTELKRTYAGWWLGLTIAGLFGTIGEWLAYSALPLAGLIDPPESEWDWSVKFVDGATHEKILNGIFSLLVFLQQAWLISLIALYVFLALAVSALVTDLRKEKAPARLFPSLKRCGKDLRLGFEAFAPLFSFYLLSGIGIFLHLFLSRVWNAFLHPDEGGVRYESVWSLVKGPLLIGVAERDPGGTLPDRLVEYLENLGAFNYSGLGVAVGAIVVASVSFALLVFTMRKSAKNARDQLSETTPSAAKKECLRKMAIWPLKYPGVTSLWALGMLGLACMLIYRLGIYFIGMIAVSAVVWSFSKLVRGGS